MQKSGGNEAFLNYTHWIILDVNMDNWRATSYYLRQEINDSLLIKKISCTINWLTSAGQGKEIGWTQRICWKYMRLDVLILWWLDYHPSRRFRLFWCLAAWLRTHGSSVYKHDPTIPGGSYVTASKCCIKPTKVTWITDVGADSIGTVGEGETHTYKENTLWGSEHAALLCCNLAVLWNRVYSLQP